MADPNNEREEIDRLEAKAEAINRLIWIARGKILKAKNTPDAIEAVLGDAIESREVLEGMELDANFSFREKLIFTDDSSEAMLAAREYVQE